MTVLWWELWLVQGMLGVWRGAVVIKAQEFKSLVDGLKQREDRSSTLPIRGRHSQIVLKNTQVIFPCCFPCSHESSKSRSLSNETVLSCFTKSLQRQHDKWLTGSADYNRKKERRQRRVSLLLPGWPSVWSTSLSPRMRAARTLSPGYKWSKVKPLAITERGHDDWAAKP